MTYTHPLAHERQFPDTPTFATVARILAQDPALAPAALAAFVAAEREDAVAEAVKRFDAALAETATWCGPFGHFGVAAYIDRRDQFLRESLAAP